MQREKISLRPGFSFVQVLGLFLYILSLVNFMGRWFNLSSILMVLKLNV